MKDVGIQGGGINGDKQDVGGKGVGKELVFRGKLQMLHQVFEHIKGI